jgi:hypothetical protein
MRTPNVSLRPQQKQIKAIHQKREDKKSWFNQTWKMAYSRRGTNKCFLLLPLGLSYLFLLCSSPSQFVSAQKRIHNLPGFNGPLPFTLETGYALFYFSFSLLNKYQGYIETELNTCTAMWRWTKREGWNSSTTSLNQREIQKKILC